MGETTVPMTGVARPTPQVGVASGAELAKVLADAGEATGVEILHGSGLRDRVRVRIPPQMIVVDVNGGGVTIGGRPANESTYEDLYAEACDRAGYKRPKTG